MIKKKLTRIEEIDLEFDKIILINLFKKNRRLSIINKLSSLISIIIIIFFSIFVMEYGCLDIIKKFNLVVSFYLLLIGIISFITYLLLYIKIKKVKEKVDERLYDYLFSFLIVFALGIVFLLNCNLFY